MVRRAGISRAEHAYDYIAREILTGRWRPGDILSTYALAEELNISRTPISAALKRLEADGLVVIIPQVGCRVSARPDEQLITELSALCGAMAGLAAESAAPVMTAERFGKLESVVLDTERALAVNDTHKLIDLNYRFYTEIAEASDMRRLILVARGMWSLLRHQLLGYPSVGQLVADLLMESAQQQRAILEALKCGAGDEARLLCERHIRGFGPRFADGPVRESHDATRLRDSSFLTGEKGKESHDATTRVDRARSRRHDRISTASRTRSESRPG